MLTKILRSYFLERYQKQRHKTTISCSFKEEHFLQKLYLGLTNISVKRLHLVPNIKSANNILDVGCGTGEVAEYIRNFLNFQTKLLGVDLERNPDLRDFIHFYQCDIDENDLPFEDSKFDVVISNFLIEHLRYPKRLFLEVHRVLRPGGYFYCTTEYFTSLFCSDSWNFYSDPTHIRPWTKRSLRSLCALRDLGEDRLYNSQKALRPHLMF